jgi:acetyl esterase/lipase
VFSGGAPWPVVDLKAAVRFLRYNAGVLPIDPARIFTFGFSMGGGVSSLMGTSGDSELYAPYLEAIGAVTHDAEGNAISDKTFSHYSG